MFYTFVWKHVWALALELAIDKGNEMITDQDQLNILYQGSDVWNKWRDLNSDVAIQLYKINLSGDNDLSNYDLSHANLVSANLSRVNLSYADLSGTDLRFASLSEANLSQAKLFATILRGADFRLADLRATNLSKADLREANLRGAQLHRSNLKYSMMGETIIGYSDLSEVVGLEDVTHSGPSSISTDVFVRSKGSISEAFLRGCGLNDWEIEQVKLYNPNLSNEEVNNIQYKIYDLRATQALQISPLFISYSQADGTFVDKLETHLNKKGVRFWRDIYDMKAGRMEKQIDRAIRLNPTVLLILSFSSIKSDWVEHEVRTAREIEKELGRDTLCPVALDDSWKSSPWPKRVMEQVMEYNILDFSAWEDDSKFENMFRRLIDGLELFYKG